MHHVNRALTVRLCLPRGIRIGGRDRQTWAWSTFISTRYLLSAYFLAVYCYKRMRLITRVYGSYTSLQVPLCHGIGNLQSVISSPMTLLTGSPIGKVCPGQQLTFTCVTNGTSSHAWSSDEYIGEGGIQLEFAAFHSPGHILSNSVSESDLGTFAQLITVENKTQGVLKSRLQITVSADFPAPNISCLNVDNGPGLTNSTTFQLLGTCISFHYCILGV